MEDNMKEQQVTLSDYMRILYRGRWIIVVSFLVVVASTVYFTFTAQPVYEASALVMLKEEGKVQQQIFEITSFMKQETAINNQVEILKSRTLAEEVIRRLEKSPRADSLWILGNRTGDEKFSLKKWLFSLVGLDKSKEPEKPTFEEIVRNFRKNVISVTPKRDTDMIELKVKAYSPSEASFVANTWVDAYRDLNINESRGEISEVVKFLDEKLKDVKKKLTASEDTLRKYKETHQVVELTAETQQLIKQLAQFESLYQEARTDLQANEKRLAYLKAQLSENQRALVDKAAGLSSPAILELQKQMAQLIGDKAAYEAQLKGMGLYAKNDQKLMGMEQRLAGLKKKILEETKKMVAGGITSLNPMQTSETLIDNILQIETENKSLKAKTNVLRRIVMKYSRELNSLPEKSQKLARLEREATVDNNIYMMMRQKYEENRIVEAGKIGSVRVVDYAVPPQYPIKPKKKMNLILGIMVGLGLGIGLTFLREYLDTSLKSMEDVEREGFTVLGSIPIIAPQGRNNHSNKRNGEIKRIESRLVTHFDPKSPISEAYRTLRTNIQYTKVDKSIKSLLVTSAGPAEGKSTSVANLAITFAQMGTKTLLVDADLRRPVLHAIFDLPRPNGLTNVLVQKLSLVEAIKPTRIENLSVLTSGTLPPNPSELLSSNAMEKVLEEMEKDFDMVLFDSPPLIAVTDAAVLATKLDGVVLVIKSGATGRDALLRSRTLLQNVDARLFGIIVNGININNMYGSYYYYYHHYYYGDGKHRKRKGYRELV